MKTFFAFFAKPISLLPLSLVAFGQLACVYVLGAMLDDGIEAHPIWWLPAVGWLVFSMGMVFAAVLLGCNPHGYKLGKVTIPSSFWFLYVLIIPCFLCFVLFGCLYLNNRESFLANSGFAAIVLSVLSLTLDGFAFFGARLFVRKHDE